MANTKEFDYLKLFYDIRNVCKGEDVCGKCREAACLVGYARECIGRAKKADTDTLPGAFQDIPIYDTQGYEMEDVLDAIAHTLQQCRSCSTLHSNDCLVNIIRNCYEIIALGKEQGYGGSTLQYLLALQKEHPEEAAHISEVYQKHVTPGEEKEKMS